MSPNRPLAPLGLAAAIALGAQARAAPPPNAPAPWEPPPVELTPGSTAPDGSTVVSELDVFARYPGPALWTVSRGDSQVVILGGLTPLPHLLDWNTIRVEHALEGASALLLPPRPQLGLWDFVRLKLESGRYRLPGKATLDSTLPAAAVARFHAIAASIHQPLDKYEHWKPAVAGFMLLSDFRRAVGFSEAKPASTVVKLAKAKGVPVRYAGEFKVAPMLQSVAALSPASNQACFEAALADIGRESSHARAAAKAWSNGDLKGVRGNYTPSVLDGCLLQVRSFQALIDRGTADGVQAIDEALGRPGKTVAVIDLSYLLRPNGLLDRLKAQGAQIGVPRE